MANLTVTDTQLNKMTQSIRGAINEKYGSMREAFKAIDTDRSGKLSRREIMRAVASFQLNIPREHLLQLMQARAASRARAAQTAAPSPPAACTSRRRRARPRAQLSDTNGDDEIDFDEFVAGLKARPPALVARALPRHARVPPVTAAVRRPFARAAIRPERRDEALPSGARRRRAAARGRRAADDEGAADAAAAARRAHVRRVSAAAAGVGAALRRERRPAEPVGPRAEGGAAARRVAARRHLPRRPDDAPALERAAVAAGVGARRQLRRGGA